MNDLRRRSVLGLSVGLTAAAAAACSGTSGSAEPPTAAGLGSQNVRDFGATGNGSTDDTAAVAAAINAAGPSCAIYFPPGNYKLTSLPALPDYATISGAGADLSTLVYNGTGTLIALTGRQRVSFTRLGIFVTGTKGTGIQLSNCFRCSFDAVTIRGQHTGSNYPQYAQARGVVLDQNTGGTTFSNCDINNFGTGLTTRCIQNYVTATKFTTNRVSVLGTGNDHTAGLSLTNVEFVSDGNTNTTAAHIKIDGAANDWFITNAWFEGCDIAMDVGVQGGGPSQFGVVNAKVAARTTGINLRWCRQPYLANVAFDVDTGVSNPPAALVINAAGCPEGIAAGLISGSADDVPLTSFPATWTVTARHGMRGPTILTPQTMQAPAVSDSVAANPVLRDANGKYWQVTVGTDGRLGTTSLGDQRPR